MGRFRRRYATREFLTPEYRGLKPHGYLRGIATRWFLVPAGRIEADGPIAEMSSKCGTDAATYIRERPGMSAFVLQDGVVYHTYSSYSRGLDGLWGMYQWLDRAPK